MRLGTFVYFLRPVGLLGPIKVGCSEEPKRRLEDMLTWSPLKLEIIATTPGTLKDESFLHRCFAASHSHREWFNPSPEIQIALLTISNGGGMPELRTVLSERGSIRAKRRPYDENTRRRISYGHRIRHAERKLRDKQEAWHAPDDVMKIMNRWDWRRDWVDGQWKKIEAILPTAEQLARIDEYLADPAAHSVIPEWKRKAAAA